MLTILRDKCRYHFFDPLDVNGYVLKGDGQISGKQDKNKSPFEYFLYLEL